MFNTDRVLLAVTYAINFAGFVMLSLTTTRRPLAAAITVAALLALNGLIMLSLSNSRREAESLLSTLIQLYKDNDLGRYFDESKLRYLWVPEILAARFRKFWPVARIVAQPAR